jgi:hypothetical protein
VSYSEVDLGHPFDQELAIAGSLDPVVLDHLRSLKVVVA